MTMIQICVLEHYSKFFVNFYSFSADGSLCMAFTMPKNSSFTLYIHATNDSFTALTDIAGPGQNYWPLETPLARGARTAAYVILLLLVFLGNVLVIHIIRRNATLRSTVDLLIVNMCVSDLFIPIFALPYQVKIITCRF